MADRDCGEAIVTLLTEERVREIVRDEIDEQMGKLAHGVTVELDGPMEQLVGTLERGRPFAGGATAVGRYMTAHDGQRIMDETGQAAYAVAMSYGMARTACDGIRATVRSHLCAALGLVSETPNTEKAA